MMNEEKNKNEQVSLYVNNQLTEAQYEELMAMLEV